MIAAFGDPGHAFPAIALGRELFAALPEPKRWLEVAHAGHNDLLAHDEVWQAIGTLLQTARGGSP